VAAQFSQLKFTSLAMALDSVESQEQDGGEEGHEAAAQPTPTTTVPPPVQAGPGTHLEVKPQSCQYRADFNIEL